MVVENLHISTILNSITFGNNNLVAVGDNKLTLYGITYNENLSTSSLVATENMQYLEEVPENVLDNTKSKPVSIFTGQNPKVYSSGPNYAATVTLVMGAGKAKVTQNVEWTIEYKVIYNGNGSTGGTVPIDSNKYLPSATVTVLGNLENLVKTNYTFGGWNTNIYGSGTNYMKDETFKMGTTNVTLYAKWIPSRGFNFF